MKNDRTFAILSLIVLTGVATAFLSVRTTPATPVPAVAVHTAATAVPANAGS